MSDLDDMRKRAEAAEGQVASLRIRLDFQSDQITGLGECTPAQALVAMTDEHFRIAADCENDTDIKLFERLRDFMWPGCVGVFAERHPTEVDVASMARNCANDSVCLSGMVALRDALDAAIAIARDGTR